MIIRSQHEFLRSQSGFSLLELLAVLGILGLTLAMAVPMVNETKRSVWRGEAISQIEFDLRRLRTEAISSGVLGIFSIAESGESYQAGFDFLPYGVPPAIEEVGFSKSTPSSITVQSDQQLIFDSRGFAVSSSLEPTTVQLTFSSGGTVFGRIFISPTGALDFEAE